MSRVFVLLIVFVTACGADGDASSADKPSEAGAGADSGDAGSLGELGAICSAVTVDAGACPAMTAAIIKAGLDPASQDGDLPTITNKVAVACLPDALGDPRCTFRCEFWNDANQREGVSGAAALCGALRGECKDLSGTGALRQCWL